MARELIGDGFSGAAKQALNRNFEELYAALGGGAGVTLTSPDGTVWELSVSNAGALITTEQTSGGSETLTYTLPFTLS